MNPTAPTQDLPPTATTAVTCRNVTKTYGSGDNLVHALRGINLEIETGELLMLVGPSGCGKTTLISVIAGILDRTGGECTVFGQDFSAMSQAARTQWRGANIGFVFQAYNLIPSLTAAENAAVPLLLQGKGMAASLRIARDLLGRVGLGGRAESLPGQLSGGQMQRVAIARALVHEPRLIVCDEPTSALDHETGHKVLQLLREVAVGPQRALVIVSHDARIFEFADRIARMDDGRIAEITPPKEPIDL